MHKEIPQSETFGFRRKQILIFIALELFIVALSFFAAAIPMEHSNLLMLPLIGLAVLINIHTLVFCIRYFNLIKNQEDVLLDIENANNPVYEFTATSKFETLVEVTEDNTKKLMNNKKSIESVDKKESLIYETIGEPFLYLNNIDTSQYSSLLILEKEITLIGQPKKLAELSLIIPDNLNCIITLDNVCLLGGDQPAICIGNSSTVKLKLVGDNQILNNGISVPETADLTLLGEGNLTVQANQSNRVGIGGTDSQSYGNITLATTGSINIITSGNTSIGIGGGHNIAKSQIKLLSGNITLTTNGSNALGIGSLLGNAIIIIDHCNLKLKCDGSKSVGIGSFHGFVDITTCGNSEISTSGNASVAIGSLDEGSGNINIIGGVSQIHFVTNNGAGLGTINGCFNTWLQSGELLIYGEGCDIIGIGDHSGKSKIKISDGVLSIQLFASSSLLTGSLPQKLIIDGGNIQCDFPENVILVNSSGTPLEAHIITDMDEYSQVIETISYHYVYRASYSDRFPYIKVFLPENCATKDY